jgi:non-canonical (house-cleaning) NTP pyrophosphatase
MTDNTTLIFDIDETFVDTKSVLYPQIPSLIKYLYDQKYRIWVVSFRDRIDMIESLEPIKKYIHAILCGFHHKGKLKMIKNLCKQYMVPLNQCILFDDNKNNILCVQEGGVLGYLINPHIGVTFNDVISALSFMDKTIDKDRSGIVYVASVNPIKISAVEPSFIGYKIIGIESDSGVSSQPIGWNETKRGAINRLKYIKDKNPNAKYWVSIESGLVQEDDVWSDVPIVAMCDNNDKVKIVRGAGVPTSFKGEDYLFDYQQEILKVNNRACEYFTNSAVTRYEIIQQTVKIAKNLI